MTKDTTSPTAEAQVALELAKKQHEQVQDALTDLKDAGQRVERTVTTSLDHFSKVRERLEELVRGMRAP